MSKIWNLKIRNSVKQEFPADLMMQELHELRLQKPFARRKSELKKLQKQGVLSAQIEKGYYVVK